MQPVVTDVRVLSGYRLAVTFDDGTSGTVDFTDLLYKQESGVFVPLRDPQYFAKVSINPEWGHIEWPNGADIDPYLLYEKAHRPVVS